MVRFSHNIDSKNKFIVAMNSCEANSFGVVWCSYNERINHFLVYRRLLTNHLHGKAAELCLANS